MAAKKKTTNAPTDDMPKPEAAATKKTSAPKKTVAKPSLSRDSSSNPSTSSSPTVAEQQEKSNAAKISKLKSPRTGKKITTKAGQPNPERQPSEAEEKSSITTKSSTPSPKLSPQAKTSEPPAIVVEPINDPDFIDFITLQKQRLLDLRDELVDAMTGSAREAIRNAPEGSEASGSGMHQGDAGSDAYDRDFALSVLAKEQDALYEIEEALQRIKKRTYGICEMSGKRIPIARLEAIPFARLTVDCQAQWEKEYGNRKFRPSGSVGFSGGGVFDDDEDSDTVSLDEDDD